MINVHFAPKTAGWLQSSILASFLLFFAFVAETKGAPADPCRNAGNGYINGYSGHDTLRVEDKVVSFTMGLPAYRVLRAQSDSTGSKMTKIEWNDNGTVRVAWVSSLALFCNDRGFPGLPPFKMGDSLEKALNNKLCDLEPSSEWSLNQATGLDSREYISRGCSLKLTFERTRDGGVRLHRGVSFPAGVGVDLSTNEGVRTGSTEDEAISEYVSRMVPEVSSPGRVLSVDGLYVGYILRVENGLVNAIEFGNVRE